MDVNDNPVIEESEIVDVVDKEEIIGTNTMQDIPAAMIEEIAKYRPLSTNLFFSFNFPLPSIG